MPLESSAGWRERVLATLLRALLLAGLPVWIWAIYNTFTQGETENGVGLVLVVAAWAWAAYGPGPQRIKAAVTTGAVLALGLAMVLLIGFSANTAMVLTLACFIGLLTMGPEAAALSIVLTTVAFAAAAYATVQYGWIPIQQDHAESATRAVRAVIMFPAFVGGAAAAVHYIITRLEASIASLSDLTERLAKSEAQFRELFNNAREGVFQTEPSGRVLIANPACSRILGYAPGEMAHLNMRDVYERPEDRDELIQKIEQSGEARDAELRLRRKDGRIVTVLLNAHLIQGEAGSPHRFQGSIVDISERRQLEEQLLQSRKLEAIGRLAGGVAHDFNNLLTAILGFAQLAREKAPVNDAQQRDLTAIENAAQSAAQLTGQLLAFSRKQVLQPRVVDLNQVIARARTLLRRVIGEDIDFIARLGPSVPQVLVDSGQIEQVILNLSINARDAMPRGGTLTIETRPVELSAADVLHYPGLKPGRYAGLAVSDTGTGIEPAALAHIFEPFFTTKEPGKGTGLGLATVYGIVQQSGGTISVDSTVGHGATFTIFLPSVTAESSADAAVAAASPASGGSETILIVEDEVEVRSVAHQILARAGYTVFVAETGAEALRIVTERAGAIDLVLADVVMPAMSGPALADSLARPAPRLPVLFMSGYAEEHMVRHGMLQANATFLPKPFTVQSLLEKVRQALDAPNLPHREGVQ